MDDVFEVLVEFDPPESRNVRHGARCPAHGARRGDGDNRVRVSDDNPRHDVGDDHGGDDSGRH